MTHISIDITELCKHTNSEFSSLIELAYLYCQKILIFIPRVETLQDYPSHGIDHSVRVIEYINKFAESFDIDLNEEEFFLLYLASWCHDIGCICGRDNHHNNSIEILRNNSGIYDIIDDKTKTCLKFIVTTHSKNGELDSVPVTYEGIRLKFLCAIFRLMDACDITSERCPRIVYKYIESTLSSESRKHWIAHLNIVSVSFYEGDICIDLFETNEALDYIQNEFLKEIESTKEILSDNGISFEVKVITDKEFILN